jgi:hypothetical protein
MKYTFENELIAQTSSKLYGERNSILDTINQKRKLPTTRGRAWLSVTTKLSHVAMFK